MFRSFVKNLQATMCLLGMLALVIIYVVFGWVSWGWSFLHMAAFCSLALLLFFDLRGRPENDRLRRFFFDLWDNKA